MTKHTTGPWTVYCSYSAEVPNARGSFEVYVDDGHGNGDHIACLSKDDPETAANMRLIEAAPNLLTALQEVLQYEHETGGLGGRYITLSGDAVRRIQAAIAKAEGRTL